MPTSDPWDGTTWSVTAPDTDQPAGNAFKEIYDLRKGIAIRMNKEHETLAASSAGGVHKQGSARAFFQDAAPATQVNGDAFDSGDLGSLWIDSNASPDNQFNILTATTPTWTPISVEIIAVLLASARIFGDALTVTGLLTANGGVTLGAGDDLIGSATSDITINTDKFTVAGATGNTSVGGTFESVGVATLADESVTKTDAAPSTDVMLANKKYVDDQIVAAIDGDVATLNDSEANAMLVAHAYLTQTSGFVGVTRFNQSAAGARITGYIGTTTDPEGAGVLVANDREAAADDESGLNFFVPNGKYFEIVQSGSGTSAINWTPLVSGGGAPIDQD